MEESNGCGGVILHALILALVSKEFKAPFGSAVRQLSTPRR